MRSVAPLLQFVNADIKDLPFATETFDVVVSWGVIEHPLEGPGQLMKEMARVLRRGGHAFITVPWLSPKRLRAGYSLDGDNLPELGDRDVSFHQHYLTEEELSAVAVEAGLNPLRVVPSSIHAKSLLSPSTRARFPVLTRLFNRLASPLLPERLIASMILLVAEK